VFSYKDFYKIFHIHCHYDEVYLPKQTTEVTKECVYCFDGQTSR